jgi:hypothetical protein
MAECEDKSAKFLYNHADKLLIFIGSMFLVLSVMEIVNFNKTNAKFDNDDSDTQNSIYGMIAVKLVATICMIVLGAYMHFKNDYKGFIFWGYVGSLGLYFGAGLVQNVILWG